MTSSVDTTPRAAADLETVQRADEEPVPPAAAPMATPFDGVRPGERVGHYMILEAIGQGGMGTVYSAFDPSLERRVAIKLLHRGSGVGPAERVRLLAEAKAMAQLSHPNVVTVHEAAIDRGRVFLAMELVAGRTAREWLGERERTWREIVTVFRQAALGLAAAHAADMVHRDVKPDNILVGTDERVRITDFGIAVGLVDGASARSGAHDIPGTLEDSGPVSLATGTPAYMSPEQLRGDPLDGRSDQFAFGVTVFEALYRRRPFGGRDHTDLRAAHAAAVVPPAGGDVPTWLRDVVLRALAIDPDRRWPSMQVLVDQLDAGTAIASRRVARWLLALAPIGIGAGVLVGGQVATLPPRCEEAEGIAQSWNDGRRSAVIVALEAAGPAFAGDTARGAVALLDDYADQWTTAYAEACTEHRSGIDSDSLFDRRQACLRARHRAVSSLVEILARADADAVRNAISAVSSLPPVRECAAERLVDDAAWAVPTEPTRRARHEAVLDAITEGQLRFRAGDYRDGLEHAGETVDRARELGDEAVLIRALLVRASYERRLDRFAAASATLDEAWHLGLRTGNTVEGVRVAIRQVELLGYDRREEAAALGRAADAVSLIERMRSLQPELADELTATLLRAHGLVDVRFARPTAVDRLDEALRMVRAQPGRSALDVAEHASALANAELAAGRRADALVHYEEVVALQIDALGAAHPDVGATRNNIGLALRNLGRVDEALVELERARAIALDAFGPGHSKVRIAEFNLAVTFNLLGDSARAVPMWELGLGLPIDFTEANAGSMVFAMKFAADLRAVGRREDALAIIEGGLAALDRGMPGDAVSLAGLRDVFLRERAALRAAVGDR